jgi:hypothetical protein
MIFCPARRLQQLPSRQTPSKCINCITYVFSLTAYRLDVQGSAPYTGWDILHFIASRPTQRSTRPPIQNTERGCFCKSKSCRSVKLVNHFPCLWFYFTTLYIGYKLTSWSWALLEKPPVVQLLKNFPAFTEPKVSLTCSQEPSTGPCPGA